MGLISTEVEVVLNGHNIKWYEDKGYIMPRRLDKRGRLKIEKNSTITVSILNLQPNSNVKIKYKCDNCGEIHETRWCVYNRCLKEDGSIYCRTCASKLYGCETARLSQAKNGTSFEQWCIDNNKQDILDRWDYHLNEYKPSEIGFKSSKKCWFKCPMGIHKSELKCISNFTSYGDKCLMLCSVCNSIGQFLINTYGENALLIYWSDKNIVNPFEISFGSGTKVYIKCDVCGYDKKVRFIDFINYGFSCPKCSDGISYPNKLAFNLLEQLNVDFIPEYSPDWIKPKRYDFYFEINNKKYILEMDGAWHKKDNNISGQTKEESKAIDNYKDQMAKENDIEVIRIDCCKSELEYIKSNLINSKFSMLFNLSKVDWNKCNEYAYSSLVKICCELWNNGFANVSQIVNELKINKHTINKYLKQGVKLGWCDYNPEYELKKNFENLSKKVYCFELDKIFNSTMDVERELGIANSRISACCLGKKRYASAGGYHWMYYEDYLKNNPANKLSCYII